MSEDPDQGATCATPQLCRHLVHTSSGHSRFAYLLMVALPPFPLTPFGGETLYFRLVLGQSPVFVPGEHEQGQEQTERCDCGDSLARLREAGLSRRPRGEQGPLLSLRWLTGDAGDSCDGMWTVLLLLG